MQALRRRLSPALVVAITVAKSFSSSSPYLRTIASYRSSHHLTVPPDRRVRHGTLTFPCSAIQHRGVKILGSDVRFGQVIQRKGRVYQVLKTQHTQHGRGGATIQVELRDVDSGNKITERFRTDEALERVFVEEKSFTFLYIDGDNVMIMEPNTFEQLDVSKDLFGKAAAYLKDNMTVSLQFYDGKPMSASIPTRVICTVAETQIPMKGITAQPQYKKALLDNGLTVQVPSFIVTGDQIIVNTIDDAYMTRAKE